jgi:dienelactone hydrolase
MRLPRFCLAVLLLLSALALPAAAVEVSTRTATVMSEGVRLHADLYYPSGKEGGRLPTIIRSHGWGGTAAMLRTQATDLAAAGYLVIAFDYRGWGQSDSRVILTAPAPAEAAKTGNRFTAEVREVREVVDPLDQAEDIFNVIHWAAGEPMVDPARIGLWGTSFSGGLVVYVAARDTRVKALFSQVGAMGWTAGRVPPAWVQAAIGAGTQRARGERGYPPPGAREVGNLRGGPILEKFLRFSALEGIERAAGCAMLFVVAEKEELFDNRDHAVLAHERARGPKRYVEIPGIPHYGIYGEAREQSTKLAIDWFDTHLKP